MFVCKQGKFVHRAPLKWQTVSVEQSQIHVHVDWSCECVCVLCMFVHVCSRVRLSVRLWLAVAPSVD